MYQSVYNTAGSGQVESLFGNFTGAQVLQSVIQPVTSASSYTRIVIIKTISNNIIAFQNSSGGSIAPNWSYSDYYSIQ